MFVYKLCSNVVITHAHEPKEIRGMYQLVLMGAVNVRLE